MDALIYCRQMTPPPAPMASPLPWFSPAGVVIAILPLVVYVLAVALLLTWRPARGGALSFRHFVPLSLRPSNRSTAAAAEPSGGGNEADAVEHRGGRFRSALLVAAVGWGIWVILGTELLSLAGAITFWGVLTWWAMAAAILAGLVWRRRAMLPGLWEMLSPLKSVASRRQWGAWLPLGITTALVSLAGLVAVLSPPNTYDVLRYHMPRQIHWMQQGSVAHLSVRDPHMTALPPMAEFAGLHLMVLSSGDFYATLIQWWAFVLTVLAASLVARELGGRLLAQSMAALFVAANPMGWLQASSGKNDMVVALWVLIIAVWVVRVLRDGRCGPGRTAVLGSAAGLAALTKATGVLYAFPLMVVLGLWLLFKRRLWSGGGGFIPVTTAIGLLALSINAGHFARNIVMFESPSPRNAIVYDGRPLTNEVFTPASIAASVIRNTTNHLGTRWMWLNQSIESGARKLHDRLGWDVDDPRTGAYEAYEVRHRPTEEAYAAPMHVLLTLAMIVVLPWIVIAAWRAHRRTGGSGGDGSSGPMPWPQAWRLGIFSLAALSALVLFCAVLKWQPWHARLHIGGLALLAPAMACVLCRGKGIGAIIVITALMVPLTPVILWNDCRPLLGERNIFNSTRQQLLARRTAWARDAEVAAYAAQFHPRIVGLHLHGQGTYLIKRRLLLDLDPPPLFTDPFVIPGRRTPNPWPAPDLVISDLSTRDHFREHSSGQSMYLVESIGVYGLFVSREVAEQLHQQGVLAELPPILLEHLAGQQ